MDHLNAMGNSNLDDLVSCKVGTDRRILASRANHVCFVRLLSVHAETVFITEDGDGLKGELVGGTENTDGDFASVGNEDLVELHDGRVGSESVVDRVLEVAIGLEGGDGPILRRHGGRSVAAVLLARAVDSKGGGTLGELWRGGSE